MDGIELDQGKIDQLIAGDRLRKEIEDFYIPKQLVDAIVDLGHIPERSEETQIGIGFLDIADYSFISKFLSPNENQDVLNGLFTAFNMVLRQHGGYLNKIEGDSLMFHFGGMTDPAVRDMEPQGVIKNIAEKLFQTCVRLQRVCIQFNQGNERFFTHAMQRGDADTLEDLRKAFGIINTLRTGMGLESSINTFFQIRIRIGASIGEATMGNLGPQGAKQWDVIGVPVIDAKRMESTAPIGGLRISEELFNILEENGIADAYYEQFRRQAGAMSGGFKDITKEELFRFGSVRLKDKKNASFNTYNIQVNPGLPESLAEQAESLLSRGDEGANRIIQFLQYYRGSRIVVAAVEKAMLAKGVNLRYHDILKFIYPKTFEAIRQKMGGDWEKTRAHVRAEFDLFGLFEKLGSLQDKVKEHVSFDSPTHEIHEYGPRMAQEIDNVITNYKLAERSVRLNNYFYNYVYPLVWRSIKISILEYQNTVYNVEEL